MNLSIVIPAYNEADSIKETITSLYYCLKKNNISHEILVVNDNSKDNTLDVLDKLKLEIDSLVIYTNDGPNGNISELSKFQKDYTLNNLIVGVGAIIDQRDYQFQILVYNELLKYNPNLKFKIIGHIYMEAPIVLAKKLGIYDKIEFLGEIPHYQVIEEIKKSDIHWMMLNGEYVGLGTATIEAMLMGIPSISNSPKKLFGKNELIDLENYIYSDGKNIDIIVNKIISVLSDKILREKIGQNGKFFVDKNLNWDYVGIEMINLFEGN